MTIATAAQRQTPRVVLRDPIEATFEGMRVLIVELGPGGAKIEHARRIDLQAKAHLVCGSFDLHAQVRHSTVLPAREGVVYHSGLLFIGVTASQREVLMRLLVEEAQRQVVDWEANLSGQVKWRPDHGPKSAVLHRFTCLQLTNAGWNRFATSDPNQPLDGITVSGDTPDEEINLLCTSYEQADPAGRELLRRMATVSILERLR